MLPTVVIIGRRNVGKSALFNRLIEEDKAIVSEVAGTTRDRTEGLCLWRGKKIRIVDTGGLDIGETDVIDKEVRKQAEFAIKEADLILFVVDARVGIQPSETMLSKELRNHLALHKQSRTDTQSLVPTLPKDSSSETKAQARRVANKAARHIPVFLIGNKTETPKFRMQAEDPVWKRLGFGIAIPISAITGAGIGDLLDTVYETLAPKKEEPEARYQKPDLKVAIIGKPNVGKSSLLNKLLGEERVIVSPIPHTTREPQDTFLTYPIKGGEKHIVLIDTAGIRKKAKTKPGVEQIGITKTLNTIRKSDVVIFVLDANELLDAQDKQLAQMIEEAGVGIVIAVNKWDLLGDERDTRAGDLLMKQIHYGLPGLTFAPVVFISANTGHSTHKLLPLALEAKENRNRIIPDEKLQEILPKLILRHKPTRGKGNTRHPVLRRIEQTGTEPPTFVAIIGPKQFLHESYLRYIENRLREYYDFEGTPIKMWATQDKN